MVRTRFAPSPTGFLHIGGVRTALFNWLFARRHGGQFILRIDDTDAERNVQEALRPILDGFKWLGLDWDEGADVGGPNGPYYQSQKLPRYQEAVRQLVEGGFAYWDYATKEENDAERKAAEREKRNYLAGRKWLAQTESERRAFEAQGRTAVVRLKMPREGACRFHDHIRGDMTVEWLTENDHIIQRENGTVLYNLANVVDDHDMKISHVIRAEEHLSNTPRQIFIARGLGYPLPEYAHVPFVAEPGSKNKLSKRKIAQYLKNPDFKKVYEHGHAIAKAIGHHTSADTFNPVIVDFYREVGYLPDAILNYLVLLGWSLDDKTEDFTRDEMIRLFSLERVNKGPASFDPKKLFAFQERRMQALSVEQKTAMCLPYLQKAKLVPDPTPADATAKVTRIVSAAGERIKAAGDILDYSHFFIADAELQYDEQAMNKRLQSPGAVKLLMEFKAGIATLTETTAASVRNVIQKVVPPLLPTTADLASRYVAQQIDALQRGAAATEGPPFTSTTLEHAEMPRFLDATNSKIGDIIHSLRIAITGKNIGFGLYDAMEILGKESCLRRIDRALAYLRMSAQHVMDEAFSRFPDALKGVLADDRPNNKTIPLYSGKIELKSEEAVIASSGTVALEWLPDPAVTFNIILGDNTPSFAPAKLNIPELRMETDVLISRLPILGGSERVVEGIVNGRFTTPNRDDLASLVFYLTNYHQYRGDIIKNENAAWVGRANWDFEDWNITIDSLPKLRERIADAARTGGSAITHIGRIKRISGGHFSTNKGDEILQALQYYLSFTRGFWVAPIMVEGLDEAGSIIWHDWTLRVFDQWQSVESWFPVHETGVAGSLFAGFWKKWQFAQREGLQTAIYWYLRSNLSQGAVDQGLIMAQIALEAVADLILSNDAAPVRHDSGNLPTPKGKIGAALQRMQINNQIPSYMNDFKGFSESINAEDALAALVALRDIFVHPTAGARAQLTSTEAFKGKVWQAWYLALWYVELCLLWWIGYNGRYASRIGEDRWVGQTDLVPWSDNPPSEASSTADADSASS